MNGTHSALRDQTLSLLSRETKQHIYTKMKHPVQWLRKKKD